jgi:protein-S-isoprenylcysteine O-methyltransferase
MQQLLQVCLRTVAFWLIFCLWTGVSFWEDQQHKPVQVNRIGRKSDLLCFFAVGAALLLALFMKLLRPNLEIYRSTWPFLLGLVLVLLGVALRHQAIATLGKYHVMTISVQPGQTVVTSGLFRYIRHPSYLGALIAVFGIALSLNSLTGSLILTLFTITVLIQRIRIEDEYLGEHLGAPYQKYTERTKRLIPTFGKMHDS